MDEMEKSYRQQIIDEEKEELEKNKGLIENFKKYCQDKCGIKLTDNNFRYIRTIGITAIYPELVKYLRPDLHRDKEGLIKFNYLTKIFKKKHISGFLYADNYIVLAHPYFRRGLSRYGNFAPRFIQKFWELEHTGMDSYLAIDFDRVRINVDNRVYLELDTWFGPKFTKQISEISDGAVHLRPPIDLDDFTIDFAFNSVYSLDIKWETTHRIKSFQAEEFKTEKKVIQKADKEMHPARYIHAEFDLNDNSFRHFDGAIHFYTNDEYYIRRDLDLNYESKSKYSLKADSEKLFKINDRISVDSWMELTGQFFTGNPLIFEYFEGKYPDKIAEMVEIRRKNK